MKAADTFRTVALAACLIMTAGSAPAERFSFAALGDTPYFDFEEPLLMTALEAMNQRPLRFVVHVGDIKSGSDRCDASIYESRAAWFGQVQHPMLVLPGDNDWTDCGRRSNGGYDPLNRLSLFRKTFHTGAFGARIKALEPARQGDQPAFSEYVENLRWMLEDVMFVAVHVVGSKNNIEVPEEFERRQRANEAWLRESFATAHSRKARALVVMMHANPLLEMAASDPRRMGFAAVTEVLFEGAAAFERPVLLIHGDTHHFRFEHPLSARGLPATLRNVSRLEVHGSPVVGWSEVLVDTDTADVFSIVARK